MTELVVFDYHAAKLRKQLEENANPREIGNAADDLRLMEFAGYCRNKGDHITAAKCWHSIALHAQAMERRHQREQKRKAAIAAAQRP